MKRKFKINNAIKGDIKMRCAFCEYEFEQIDRYHHLVVFDDEIMNLVISGKLDEAEERVRHAVGCIRSES